jgi:hypothetical protein
MSARGGDVVRRRADRALVGAGVAGRRCCSDAPAQRLHLPVCAPALFIVDLGMEMIARTPLVLAGAAAAQVHRGSGAARSACGCRGTFVLLAVSTAFGPGPLRHPLPIFAVPRAERPLRRSRRWLRAAVAVTVSLPSCAPREGSSRVCGGRARLAGNPLVGAAGAARRRAWWLPPPIEGSCTCGTRRLWPLHARVASTAAVVTPAAGLALLRRRVVALARCGRARWPQRQQRRC